ncbi:MAG: hypothetical protein JST62_00045 [Bacteroidetes bacterium]|jgi:hypothetical protein|nr:hypothetical protein [Bacteroidota bacterium]
MLSDNEQLKIQEYLLEQKLPLDILVEIEDHISCQIIELQKEKGLDFDNAFLQAQDSWRKELKPYWNGSWDLEDRSDLVRKFEQQIWLHNGIKSLQWSLLIALFLGASSIFFQLETLEILTLIVSILAISIVTFSLIRYWKTFRLSNKYYPKYTLTLYQSYAFIPLSMGYFLFKFPLEYQAIAKGLYLLFAEQEIEFWTIGIFLLCVAYFSFCLFSLFCQMQYLKRIKLVMPFLQKL